MKPIEIYCCHAWLWNDSIWDKFFTCNTCRWITTGCSTLAQALCSLHSLLWAFCLTMITGTRCCSPLRSSHSVYFANALFQGELEWNAYFCEDYLFTMENNCKCLWSKISLLSTLKSLVWLFIILRSNICATCFIDFIPLFHVLQCPLTSQNHKSPV